MRVQRHSNGSVRYDKRRKTWNYLWYDGSVRRSKRIGTKRDFPTKTAVWKEVERIEGQDTLKPEHKDSVRSVIAKFETERMPSRHSTARVYRNVLKNYVLPSWGEMPIAELQPRPVELWLRQLPLAPKSRTHIRSMMHMLVDFAMWAGMLDVTRNPMSLVRNIGATQRVRKARSLTVEQFQALLKELREPFSTMALVSVCLGLRISETLGLRWSDIDFDGASVCIRRGVVNQRVADVKTQGSARSFTISADLVSCLQSWKRLSEFSEDEDWVFASPFKIGRLPRSYTGTRTELGRAAKAAGIGHLSTHAFRHTHRSWLDAVGTPISVQQKMMRHSDIRTTMNIYGEVVTDEMATAGLKVAQLAFQRNRAQDRAQIF